MGNSTSLTRCPVLLGHVYSLLELDLYTGFVIIQSESECSPDGATQDQG